MLKPGLRRKQAILVVVGQLEIGGTERHLLHVLPALADRGFNIKLFVLSRGGRLEKEFVDRGIEVLGTHYRGFKIVKLILACWALLRILWSTSPKILHCFLPEAYLVGGVVSFFAPQTELVMSRRSLNNYQRKHPYLSVLEKFLHKRLSVALANSRSIRNQLLKEGIPEKKLRLLYNGVAEIPVQSDIAMQLRKEIGIPQESVLILTIANLIPYKGHLDMLSALALLKEEYGSESWHFLAIGRDTGIGDQLGKSASKLGISDKVTWYGESDDVYAALSAADIAVLCSHEEGFSNFILEAMSAGLPVIATKVGGSVEAIIEGTTGHLVEPCEPSALAEKIAHLIRDASARASFGDAGRARARLIFSQELCSDNYSRVYDELIMNQAEIR